MEDSVIIRVRVFLPNGKAVADFNLPIGADDWRRYCMDFPDFALEDAAREYATEVIGGCRVDADLIPDRAFVRRLRAHVENAWGVADCVAAARAVGHDIDAALVWLKKARPGRGGIA